MNTAKVFETGRSQAIRLPKEYRFTEKEVGIKKLGDIVLLFPKECSCGSMLSHPASVFFLCHLVLILLRMARESLCRIPLFCHRSLHTPTVH